ncbi:DedA family protein [Paenibacillus sp. UNC451MF]|uniref:DedA family protein n=1 Tax=Paenibacillus sp. UNC451MF TaxID=1449063 RepID=UPI00048BDB01|nr:DedA family protein [Paenibacillus sp. UNC451MF]
MSYDTLLGMIGDYGYAALFFALWLGIVGMPIPDEVIVMTGGAATASGLLHEVPAFLLTYLGVISGLSLGYFLGRIMGDKVIEKWKRKKKMEKYLSTSEKLVEKYGHFALVVSYFFPVVRHVTPYIVGINKMSFRKYALLSYSTGLVWTLIFFAAGRMAGDHVEEVGLLIHSYGLKLLWVPVAAAGIWIIYKMTRSKNSNLDAGNGS